jgi:hypothetical protein
VSPPLCTQLKPAAVTRLLPEQTGKIANEQEGTDPLIPTATAIRARLVVKLDGKTALDTTRKLDSRYDLPMLLRELARQLEEELSG